MIEIIITVIAVLVALHVAVLMIAAAFEPKSMPHEMKEADDWFNRGGRERFIARQDAAWRKLRGGE